MTVAARLVKGLLQEVLLRESFVWRLPVGRESALTFDDGPHPQFTAPVLDLLGIYGIKATFFVVGSAAEAYPELLRRMVDEGHTVGSHTQTHRELPSLGREELEWELHRCREVIAAGGGGDTRLVRPPRGRMDIKSLYRATVMHYTVVHWSKTFSDYLRDGTEPLLRRLRADSLQPRDIALFHDNNQFTVEALTEMLPRWISEGRSFARIV
jgi:peptidoglycan-N-acetylglucosamine deacetylase